jgi:hypothetical protein
MRASNRVPLAIASRALRDQRVTRVRPGRRALLEPLARKASVVLSALLVLLGRRVSVEWLVPKGLRVSRASRDRLGLKGRSVLLDLRAPLVRLERLGPAGQLELPGLPRS